MKPARNGVAFNTLEHAGPGGWLDKPQLLAKPEGDGSFVTRPKRSNGKARKARRNGRPK